MAISASTVFEVRTTGSDSANGGGFVTGASGTDYSQADGAHVTFDGTATFATTGAATSTLTLTGYTVASADIGNILQITGGGNATTGFFQITAVGTAGNTWTLDRNACTAALTAMTGGMGGALATIAKAATAVVAGNFVYVKATATYSISANITFSTAGSGANPIVWTGYTTSRTDGGSVTVQASASCTAMFNVTGGSQRFKNFILDGNGQATTGCFSSGTTNITANNIVAKNFTTTGFTTGSVGMFKLCRATAGTTAATAAFNSSGSPNFEDCLADANGCPGFVASGAPTFNRCVANTNTGTAVDGFVMTGNYFVIEKCVARANGRDGIRSGAASVPQIRNNILTSNTGNGLNFTSALRDPVTAIDYNAYLGNGTAVTGVAAGSHDITLTASPFTNAASNDFSLNNTAGGGALLRGGGTPGVTPFGTSYQDIGPLQHQDSPSNIFILSD